MVHRDFVSQGHDIESSVARGVLQVAQPRGGAHSVFRRRRTRTLPRRMLQCTGENANYMSMREPTADNNQNQVPLGGAPFHVSWNFPPSPGGDPLSPRKRDFSCQTPTSHALPSIPENVGDLHNISGCDIIINIKCTSLPFAAQFDRVLQRGRHPQHARRVCLHAPRAPNHYHLQEDLKPFRLRPGTY